jgi:ATP adenylyltransferase
VERLWTPWRAAYITGAHAVEGCVFCQMAAATDDDANLIVARGEHVFVVMNLFPYHSGHVMIVPYRHLDDPVSLSPGERQELMDWPIRLLEAFRATLRPEGFNIGMNVGRAAGAGIADHLHLHIVPRWVGDTNFMPIIGATKVLPELLPETRDRLRSALAGERPSSPSMVSTDGEAAEEAMVTVDETAVAAPQSPVGEGAGTRYQPVDGPPPLAPGSAPVPPADEPVTATALSSPVSTTGAEPVSTTGAEPVSVPPTPQAGAVVMVQDKVVLRRAPDGTWVLPKGHIEEGETAERAALREVEEEMGLTGALGPAVGELTFMQGRRERHVRYFLVYDARPLPSFSEHLGHDTFLLSSRDALERLTHPDARVLVARALEMQRAERRR